MTANRIAESIVLAVCIAAVVLIEVGYYIVEVCK